MLADVTLCDCFVVTQLLLRVVVTQFVCAVNWDFVDCYHV